MTLFEGVIGQTGSNFVSEGLGVDLGSWCCGVLVTLGMVLWCCGGSLAMMVMSCEV